MIKVLATEIESRKTAKIFCNYIFRLKQLLYIYRELYEDEHSHYLMRNTSHAFFLERLTAQMQPAPKSGAADLQHSAEKA